MAFLLGLISVYVLLWIISLFIPAASFADPIFRGALATSVMFFIIGLSHFLKPAKLEAMIPENWPYKRTMNYISGAAEIAGGIGLLFQQTRFVAACCLIILLICILPANINVAFKKKNFYSISRPFFQPLYIAWIWWFCLHN